MASGHKSCLVTGCSEGGVGAALAKVFSERGYKVFATARSPSKIPKSLHSACTIISLDVASSSSIAEAAKVVEKETGGRLDVLINNAGIGMNMPQLDTSAAEVKKLFDINFFGAMEMTQVFSPMLLKAGGYIVNNASIGGMRPLVFTGTYGASKAAMINASDALRQEVAPLGIRVLTLIAGGIKTKFIDNFEDFKLPKNSYYHSIKEIIAEQPSTVPYGMEPEAFAKEVLQQVERRTTGRYWIGGGSTMARPAYWLFPEWVIDKIMLSMKRPFMKQLAEERKKWG